MIVLHMEQVHSSKDRHDSAAHGAGATAARTGMIVLHMEQVPQQQGQAWSAAHGKTMIVLGHTAKDRHDAV
ncbi:hypothetical protein HHUSO_G21531 [Huso huso]|uniref:Uncharacterized protein n=1 Tax=Huso huso TaxID=61971 RepID=A0ABR0YZ74_HUSHU